MNKEDKLTFQDLADWLDRPLSNTDIDFINFILTSIKIRYRCLELQQKVNQLETNIDEAIEYLNSYYAIYKNATDGFNYGFDSKKAISILERGKEDV